MPRPAEAAPVRSLETLEAARPRIRWRIFALVVSLGAVAYFQQKGVTIAAERIMPELSLTQMQIGWLQWAFVLGYTPTQILAGHVGERFGARLTLTVAGLLAVAATIAMPLAPIVLAGGALFAGLLLSQLTLGIAQAPTFPVGAGVVRVWLPARRWGFANGIQSMGLQLGAAATPPVIVLLMQSFGWQRALFWTSLPALALILVWAWYARNTPREHPSVSRTELAELESSNDAVSETGRRFTTALRLLMGRDVLLLTASYMGMNYVYYLLGNWSFLYLVQERHLGVLESGWLAALPPLGAALGAGLGGGLVDWLCVRFGTRWGYRLVPLASLPLVAALLVFAVFEASALVAILTLSLCYAIVELNEGAYWAATMRVAGNNTMTATGLLNTGGALGGLIGIPIVAYLSGRHEWNAAFLLGAVCAVVSAVAWIGVDATRRAAPSLPHVVSPGT
jgi:MFS transporter, ACS family, glucarate transporter